jgi:GDPmannose 4,6-dehydratase
VQDREIAHPVRDLCRLAFEHVGLDYEKYLVIDERLYRPAEVDHLLGNSEKARAELSWEPKVEFEELVRMMVDADIDRLRGHSFPRLDVALPTSRG